MKLHLFTKKSLFHFFSSTHNPNLLNFHVNLETFLTNSEMFS